jgi:phosphonate transport system permease protein
MSSTDEESYRTLEEAALRVRYHRSFASGGPWPWAMSLAALALLIFGLWYLGFSPAKILLGLGSLGNFVVLMFPPDWGDNASLWRYLRALGETVAIALLGTMLAAVIALPLSFIAARNTTVSRILRFFARRSFDTLRGIDTLVWALIWVNVVGLGPFAGVLAIASSDIGSFGKLFSEAIEGSDRKPVEGILAAGGSRLHAIRFGILPQVAPVLIGQYLYYFESNTRSATIIGIVGAGGIGLQLSEQIRTLEWQTVCFIIIMILVTVSVIDLISSRLRTAIIGKSGPAV